MAKTRGAKTSSPSSRPRAPREAPVQGSMIEPSQPLAIPPSVEGAPLNSPSRQYEMRRPPTTPGASSFHAKKSSSRPPKKKARVSAPLEPSEPPLEPQSPATESQIPSGMTPELVIRPWSLSHPLRVIWIAELGHSTPSFALIEIPSILSQSLEIPSIYCRDTIWSI